MGCIRIATTTIVNNMWKYKDRLPYVCSPPLASRRPHSAPIKQRKVKHNTAYSAQSTGKYFCSRYLQFFDQGVCHQLRLLHRILLPAQRKLRSLCDVSCILHLDQRRSFIGKLVNPGKGQPIGENQLRDQIVDNLPSSLFKCSQRETISLTRRLSQLGRV